MVELPSSSFGFQNYDAGCIPTEVYVDEKKFLRWLGEQVIVGYQQNPSIRMRDDALAVLFSFDGNEYWSHVPNKVFDKHRRLHVRVQ